jgi:FAD/FMN-containing dehydrogenase
VSHTGAAGLTLGGGFGRLGRRFGLTCDNVVGIDLVTADGQLRRAGAGGDRELLWGLRGGGGNFGVATGFEYALHPVGPMVLAGPVVHPFAKAREVLEFFADYAPTAPDEVNVDLAIVAPPGAKPMVAMEVVYSGDPRRADRALATIRGFGKPLVDGIRMTPYLKIQQGADAANAAGRQYYIKSGFVKDVRPELLDAIAGSFEPDPGRATVLLLQQLGGAIGRMRNTDTAFPHREAVFDLLGLAGWDDPAQNDRHIAWVKRFWSAIGGYTSGFYFNTDVGDDQAKVRANFGVNYPRLVRLKNRVDPQNRFRLNANVEPDPRVA